MSAYGNDGWRTLAYEARPPSAPRSRAAIAALVMAASGQRGRTLMSIHGTYVSKRRTSKFSQCRLSQLRKLKSSLGFDVNHNDTLLRTDPIAWRGLPVLRVADVSVLGVRCYFVRNAG